jgi:hypothetical protein
VGGRPPTRLLEVTKGKYRLIQSAQYGPCPTYATLSHCCEFINLQRFSSDSLLTSGFVFRPMASLFQSQT